MAVGSFRIRIKNCDFSIETDLIGLVVRHIVEEDLAICIGRRPFAEFVTLRDELPALAGNQYFLERRIFRNSCFHRRGVILPEPAHRIGKDSRGLLVVVPAIAPNVLHLVAGKGKRPLHGLILHPPVTSVNIEIIGAILQEDTDRFRFKPSNKGRVNIPSAQADIGANRTEYAAEFNGPLPGGSKGGDSSTGESADGAVIAVMRKPDGTPVRRLFRFDLGQKLFQQEARIVITEAIVFIAAIKTVECRIRICGVDPAVHNKDADSYRHFVFVNEIVEDGGCFEFYTVLTYENTGRFCWSILRGNVDPIFPCRARKYFRTIKAEFEYFTFRHAGLQLRVATGFVVVGGLGGDRRK